MTKKDSSNELPTAMETRDLRQKKEHLLYKILRVQGLIFSVFISYTFFLSLFYSEKEQLLKNLISWLPALFCLLLVTYVQINMQKDLSWPFPHRLSYFYSCILCLLLPLLTVFLFFDSENQLITIVSIILLFMYVTIYGILLFLLFTKKKETDHVRPHPTKLRWLTLSLTIISSLVVACYLVVMVLAVMMFGSELHDFLFFCRAFFSIQLWLLSLSLTDKKYPVFLSVTLQLLLTTCLLYLFFIN